MALVFVRPRRSATIRTRLGVGKIREQLDAFAQAPEPDGMGRFFAHGHFKGGSVGTRDFHLDYHFNSGKNPQTYDVHGTIAETPDWRIVRLKLRAHHPWMHPWPTCAGPGASSTSPCSNASSRARDECRWEMNEASRRAVEAVRRWA